MELTFKEATLIVGLLETRKYECEDKEIDGEGRERLAAKVELRKIAEILDKFNKATL